MRIDKGYDGRMHKGTERTISLNLHFENKVEMLNEVNEKKSLTIIIMLTVTQDEQTPS